MFGCYLFGVSHGITFLIQTMSFSEVINTCDQKDQQDIFAQPWFACTNIDKAWDRIFVIDQDDSKLQSRDTEECIKADKSNLRSIFFCLCLITN